MKSPRKSRNISHRKMRRAVLRRRQEEILRDWLNYLLGLAFCTTLRSQETNARHDYSECRSSDFSLLRFAEKPAKILMGLRLGLLRALDCPATCFSRKRGALCKG